MASPLDGGVDPRRGAVCGGSLSIAGPFRLLPIILAPSITLSPGSQINKVASCFFSLKKKKVLRSIVL